MAQEYAKAVVAAAALRRSAVGHLVDELRVTTTIEDALRFKAEMAAVHTDYASILAATVAIQARNDVLAAQLKFLRQRPHPN
jgi:hypothetical protein